MGMQQETLRATIRQKEKEHLNKKLNIFKSQPAYMKRSLTLTLIALSLFSSCRLMNGRSIRGDGNVTKQTRNIRDFDAIDVSNAIDVYVRQDSTYSVRVEVDDNLQQYVEVYVDGNTLHIKPSDNNNLDATGDIKVFISAPAYKDIQASGACNVFG